MSADRDCRHGQLARSCETCLYESEIGDLEAERDLLRAEIARHHADFQKWEDMADRAVKRADRAEAERDELRRVAGATVIYMRLSGGDLPELAKAIGSEFDAEFPALTDQQEER